MPRRALTSGVNEGGRRRLLKAWRRSGLPVALSKLAPFGVQVAVSAVAYTTGLGFAQLVGATLRVSCNTGVLSSALGCIGVGGASAFAGHMGRHAKRQVESGKPLIEMLKAPFWDDIQLDEVVLDAFCGVVAFKMWGGSFKQVMPSDLRYPGAFGHQSLPSRMADHSSDVEKRQLMMIFKRDGCHHCGTRRGAVIGDSMPSTKVSKEVAASASHKMVEVLTKFRQTLHMGGKASVAGQRYFAQCSPCSLKQAVVLRHGRRTPIVLHQWLVPPGTAPGAVVGLRAYVTSPYALSSGGGRRQGALWPWGRGGGGNNTTTQGGGGNHSHYSQPGNSSLFHSQLQLMAAESPITPSPPRNITQGTPRSCPVVPLTFDDSEMVDNDLAVAPLP